MKRKLGSRGYRKGKKVNLVKSLSADLASTSTKDNGMDQPNDDQAALENDPEPYSVGPDKMNSIVNIEVNLDLPSDQTDKVGQDCVDVKLKQSKILEPPKTTSDGRSARETEKSNPQATFMNVAENEKDETTCLDGQTPELHNSASEKLSRKRGRIKISSQTVKARHVGKLDDSAQVNSGRKLVTADIVRVADSTMPHHLRKTGTKLLDNSLLYNEKELSSALAVIEKVMKMDAAGPFSSPVDPVACGIPDYFDIIKTPMDFGTICTNLEKQQKYMNSKDVYKDVQYIWDNCCTYNNKGDYIVDLMKRVKKNFMKYWLAAGLYSDVPGTSEGIEMEDTIRPILEKSCTGTKTKRKCRRSEIDEHESNCLCAVCAVRRRKKEQEGSAVNCQANMLQGDSSQQSELEMSTSGRGDTPSAKHNSSSTSFRKRKRAHKKTKTEDIMIARKLLYWNVSGQPYGRGRAKLASYCGVYVKEVFAPSPDKWDKLSKEKKEMAWHHIQRIFLLEDASKDWVMMTMGTCWRNWKSSLSRKIKAAENMADAEANVFDNLRPEHVSLDQWKTFVDNRRSKSFKEKSEKYQKLSKKNQYRHTIGRMGYAELEDKLSKEQVAQGEGPDVNRTKKWIVAHMKKDKKDPTKKPVPVNDATALVIEKLQNASPGKSIMDDPLAQHLGEEHRGRVRGFGLGATTKGKGWLGATTKGKGVVRNENSTKELRVENENLKERVSIQETQMEKVMKMVEQLVAERHTTNQQALTMVVEPSVTTSNNTARQCQTISLHRKKDQAMDELKGKRCKLIHYEGTGEVVADGIISETNPKATCHGEQLGRFFYGVQVDKVYDNSLELPVCALNFTILKDSIGSFIKWPKVFIVPD